MKMNNCILIDGSLEITLEWSGVNTDKESFLYLVAFTLSNGEVYDLCDIIFRDKKEGDGWEYSGIKKNMYLSGFTQKLKLNTKDIEGAITGIVFLLFSFMDENISKGKLTLRYDGKTIEQKYELSSNQNLCVEFGHLKRCSNYWELQLDTMEYRSIETPYRLFASKNLKKHLHAIDIFNLKTEVGVPKDQGRDGIFGMLKEYAAATIKKIRSSQKSQSSRKGAKFSVPRNQYEDGSTSEREYNFEHEQQTTSTETKIIDNVAFASENPKTTEKAKGKSCSVKRRGAKFITRPTTPLDSPKSEEREERSNSTKRRSPKIKSNSTMLSSDNNRTANQNEKGDCALCEGGNTNSFRNAYSSEGSNTIDLYESAHPKRRGTKFHDSSSASLQTEPTKSTKETNKRKGTKFYKSE